MLRSARLLSGLVSLVLVACTGGPSPSGGTEGGADPTAPTQDDATDTVPGPTADTSAPVTDAPPPVAPLGSKALLYAGDGAFSTTSGSYGEDGFYTKAPAILAAVGITADVAATLDDVSPYRTIFWHAPGSGLPEGARVAATTRARIDELLARGGRLVVLGDWNYASHTAADGKTYSGTASNAFINRLLADLGSGLRIDGAHETRTAGCPAADSTHPAMASVPEIATHGNTFLTVSGAATWLSCPLLAAERVGAGEVVLSSDTNIFSTHATANAKLLQNLASAPVP